MIEEAHVSGVSVGNRVCMLHDFTWATSINKMVDMFLITKPLLLYLVLIKINLTDPSPPHRPRLGK